MGEGDRRVEPVPHHPDIAICAVDAVDLHPVDKAVGRAGQRPLQKPLPARYRARGAKLEAANGAFEPRAFGRFQLVGALVENRLQACCQLAKRGAELGKGCAKRLGCPRQLLRCRVEMRLQVLGAG